MLIPMYFSSHPAIIMSCFYKMRINIPRPTGTSIRAMLAQNHSLDPSDDSLPTSSNSHRLPVMPNPEHPDTNALHSVSTDISNDTSDSTNTYGRISTPAETLGVAVAGIVVVIVLCILAQILAIRVKGRRQCREIHWDYPAAKSNPSAPDPVSESGGSNLTTSTTRRPLTEAALTRKTSFKTKLHSLFRKISPFKFREAETNSMGLASLDRRNTALRSSTILRGT
ncbi:hypothetical protein PGT21_002320 [Puccinia graminis f. sp. tritici]|uniref:Uncharacterized protein n=1 Tax=Puccinia graminis f. sp. tritici TaxID=56615 RepID=A0A5B0QE40_PUCGR|nr:hypothetical protein PGT21_002320 [Puccinia graminis f. sp. tritici]KAA1123751.1 hypothetical protein PGTUg99_013220 [Puccinia graminis f. sp. tritici]